jgi:hypothetical protein
MIWLQALLAIPGAIALSLVVTRLWPGELTNRVVPVLLVLMALACVLLPLRIEIAIAVAPVAAVLAARTGFTFTGHEAPDYSRVRTVAGSVRERFRKPAPPAEVTEFLTLAYPDPATPDDPGNGTVADAPDVDPEGKLQADDPPSKLKKLLDSSAALQRPGARKWVPDL